MARHRHLLTPFGMAQDHRTQLMRVGKQTAPIDRQLASLIRLLWKHGVQTVSSCENSGWLTGLVVVEYPTQFKWLTAPMAMIVFATRRDAERFKRLTAASSVPIFVGWTPMFPDGGRRVWATNFATKDIAVVTKHVQKATRSE